MNVKKIPYCLKQAAIMENEERERNLSSGLGGSTSTTYGWRKTKDTVHTEAAARKRGARDARIAWATGDSLARSSRISRAGPDPGQGPI